MSSLEGKVIWLTGASSGIGRALAVCLSEIPCKLVLSARSEAPLLELANELSSELAEIFVAPVDVTLPSSITAAKDSIEERFASVEVLIANAGTHVPSDVEQFNTEEYRKIMEVNYFGALNCIEAVLPSMLAKTSGYIVGVSSVAGYRGLPLAAAYGASKSALSHFLESARFTLEKSNIAVSVVTPGFVKTPLTDKNDFKMPMLISAEEAAVAFVRGMEKQSLEIHFPKKFTYLMKLLRILPYPLYHRLITASVPSS